MQTERSSTALLTLKFMSSIVKTQDELIKTYSFWSWGDSAEQAAAARQTTTKTNDDNGNNSNHQTDGGSVIVSNLRFLIRWLQTSRERARGEEINEKNFDKQKRNTGRDTGGVVKKKLKSRHTRMSDQHARIWQRSATAAAHGKEEAQPESTVTLYKHFHHGKEIKI